VLHRFQPRTVIKVGKIVLRARATRAGAVNFHFGLVRRRKKEEGRRKREEKAIVKSDFDFSTNRELLTAGGLRD
jgi:hypothetical protein